MEKQRPSITISDTSFVYDQNNSSSGNWQIMYEQEKQARIRLEEENNVLRIRYQKLMEKKFGNHPICAKCQIEKPNISKPALKQQFKNFSREIEKKFKDKIPSSQQIIESSAEEIEEEEVVDKTKIPFMQNFAVLGIPDQQIAQFNQNQSAGGVIWSMRKVTAIQQHAVHFAVPSGMNAKSITGQKILQKVPKIMTNHGKQNIFLLIFKQQQGRFDKLNEQSKQLIDILNPGRKLFCLCIGTYDFTYIPKQSQNQGEPSFSAHSFQLPSSKLNTSLNNSDIYPTFSSVSQVTASTTHIKVSQRVYCILSYFPFFSFFSGILISLLNLIKAERLEINQGRIEDIKKIDSRFQIKRIKKHFSKYLKYFNKQDVKLNMVYHLNLLNQSLLLQTQLNSILYSESEEWDYQVLSLFNLDTFIKVFTLYLLEDKLFFICDQSKILTFTVYLISTYLCRPFKGVFEPVCIIPKQQQFLNSPFPSAYGVLKKKEWIKQKKILQRFKNTYVFISPTGIKIQCTENRDEILAKKPKKLISQLTPLFNKMKQRKQSRQVQLNYNKQQQTQYNWYSQREDRDIVIGILETVRKYLTLQVQRWIPSIQVLAEIKNGITKQMVPQNKDFHSFLIDRIIFYIIQQRNSKNPFVQHLLRTQMLSQHISELLDTIEQPSSKQ